MRSKQRGSRRKDPRELAERRMRMYRPEMWEILNAAAAGKNYTRTFETHNQTNAFLSRYYKFRQDAMEINERNAKAMLFLEATGVDAEGQPFVTRYQDAQGPFTVTWKYSGPAMQPEAPLSYDPAAVISTERKLFDEANDPFTQAMRKHGYAPPLKGHVCKEWNEYGVCVEPTCGKPKDVQP